MNKSTKWLTTVYVVLRVLVVVVLIIQLTRGMWFNVFISGLTLILFMIPTVIERRLKIDVPDTLEIIILCFIFAAQILGEIGEFYVRIPHWDTILHTTNGFLMAAIGVAMIKILNQSHKVSLNLSPVFEAFVAFCFSMTVGVVWEFFEYSMDCFFQMDMQKDTIVSLISTIKLNPQGSNVPIIISGISNTVALSPDGGVLAEISGGYLDIGLHDTMKDMFVNLIGAVVFSVIGILLPGKNQSMSDAFVPRPMAEIKSQSIDATASVDGAGQDQDDL